MKGIKMGVEKIGITNKNLYENRDLIRDKIKEIKDNPELGINISENTTEDEFVDVCFEQFDEIMGEDESLGVGYLAGMAAGMGWFDKGVSQKENEEKITAYFDGNSDGQIDESELKGGLSQIYNLAYNTDDKLELTEASLADEADETGGADNENQVDPTKSQGENSSKIEQKEVTVQKWGTGEDDCLSRIIQKHVPEIKLYGSDYNTYLKKIQEDNGIKNPDIIHTGDIITLPVIKKDEQGNILRTDDGAIQFYTKEEIEEINKNLKTQDGDPEGGGDNPEGDNPQGDDGVDLFAGKGVQAKVGDSLKLGNIAMGKIENIVIDDGDGCTQTDVITDISRLQQTDYYDEQGSFTGARVACIKYIENDSGEKVKTGFEHYYDKDGNLTRISTLNEDGTYTNFEYSSDHRTSYKYDENGDKVKLNDYDAFGQYESILDENGKEIGRTYKPSEYETYKYDIESGKMYDNNGAILYLNLTFVENMKANVDESIRAQFADKLETWYQEQNPKPTNFGVIFEKANEIIAELTKYENNKIKTEGELRG